MRMGGFSWLTRRPLPPVTHTHALFAGQSHSIPDNLVALLGHRGAWNCSNPKRVFGNTSSFAERENSLELCPLSEVIRKPVPTGSFSARVESPGGDTRVVFRLRSEPSGVRGHDKPPLEPRLAGPIGTQQFRNGLDRRFYRQHIETGS